MSKRAEQRALEAYPVFYKGDKYNNPTNQKEDPYDSNLHDRVVYEQAYTQAERDLALTWEDIERIEHYCEQVNREHNMGTFRGTPYGKSFFKEVARRFNKTKEEKK